MTSAKTFGGFFLEKKMYVLPFIVVNCLVNNTELSLILLWLFQNMLPTFVLSCNILKVLFI